MMSQLPTLQGSLPPLPSVTQASFSLPTRSPQVPTLGIARSPSTSMRAPYQPPTSGITGGPDVQPELGSLTGDYINYEGNVIVYYNKALAPPPGSTVMCSESCRGVGDCRACNGRILVNSPIFPTILAAISEASMRVITISILRPRSNRTAKYSRELLQDGTSRAAISRWITDKTREWVERGDVNQYNWKDVMFRGGATPFTRGLTSLVETTNNRYVARISEETTGSPSSSQSEAENIIVTMSIEALEVARDVIANTKVGDSSSDNFYPRNLLMERANIRALVDWVRSAMGPLVASGRVNSNNWRDYISGPNSAYRLNLRPRVLDQLLRARVSGSQTR